MLLISQHATIFLNFQFPKLCVFYSPTHVPSQKNLEILLQSSVSLTSSETYLQKLAKPVKLPLFCSSTSSFSLHFELENPFFFLQTSSSSLSKKKSCAFLPLKRLLNVPSYYFTTPLISLLSLLYSTPKKTFEYPLVIHQLLIPDGPFPLSHQNSLILPKIQPMSPSPMVSFSLSHQKFFI